MNCSCHFQVDFTFHMIPKTSVQTEDHIDDVDDDLLIQPFSPNSFKKKYNVTLANHLISHLRIWHSRGCDFKSIFHFNKCLIIQ